MKNPMKYGGPESVGKPLEILSNFFSKLGKSADEQGKRTQAFADTVQLHRELEKVTTEEQSKRLQGLAQYHIGVQPVMTSGTVDMSPEGRVYSEAKYRGSVEPAKEGNEKKSKEEVTPPKNGVKKATNKPPKTSSTKKPKAVKASATAGKKKAPAQKPAPKVNKTQQEINESL